MHHRDAQQHTTINLPLEITPSSPIPPKRLFDDIRSKNTRRTKSILTLIVSIAIVITIASAIVIIMSQRNKKIVKATTTTSTEDMDDTTEDETSNTIMNNLEPNPPPLPDSMKLFHPPQNEQERDEMKRVLQSYSDPIVTWEEHSNQTKPEGYPDYTYTADNHFSTHRTALLFAPGTYEGINFEVGYYTSVLGLGGSHPDEVLFTNCDRGPFVQATEKYKTRPPNGSGLDTFWRSIENIATKPNHGMQWVVSQAAPLRRMHIMTNLDLFDGDSWVSGGVATNMIVDGTVNFGGQQQWLMRNVELKGGAVNGAWSLVYVGCTGKVPVSENDGMGEGGPSISVEKKTNIRVEKPYIAMKSTGQSTRDGYELELRVPTPTFGEDTTGTHFEDENDDVRNFTRVKLAVPSKLADTAEAAKENRLTIQKALDEGKDLVLSPGIYPLSASLIVKNANQVILGLGYATLVAPNDGSPCIAVHSGVPGVRIAGIMLEASVQKDSSAGTSSLLEWGSETCNDPGDVKNPGVLSDVYARVGGNYRDVSVDVMVQLHSGNIYGDNLWLWRADHVQLHQDEQPNFPTISTKYRQTVQGECIVKNGLVVGEHASNVTIVGLAVEHTTEDQVIWNGDDGQVYFYQSELPYDADQTFADNRFVGYKIGSNVQNHKAKGLGIYSNFRDHDVKTWTAIEHPVSNGIEMSNIFTVKLDNQGQINTIINGYGPGPTSDDTPYGTPLRCSDNNCMGE